MAEAAGLLEEQAGDLPAFEQARLIRLLVDRVEYDARSRRLSVILNDDAAACIKASA
jgi:hypothetical protein